VLPGLGGRERGGDSAPADVHDAPTSAIIMLSCIYWGALFGGAITSILFNIPGEPWSVATTFDGYPLAQKGRAGHALTAAFTSSFIGALVAVIVITSSPGRGELRPQVRSAGILRRLLPDVRGVRRHEQGQAWKTISSMMIGFALAAVGLDSVTGQLRLTFGFIELLQGFDFLIAVIGLFGIGEILLTSRRGSRSRRERAINVKAVIEDLAGAAAVLAYVAAQLGGRLLHGHRAGRRDARLVHGLWRGEAVLQGWRPIRTGQVEGVVAPETAAHAAGTSALLPMLTLGVPGSPTAAVLLGDCSSGAFNPGPMLFVETEGFRLGPDREHVPRQHRRPDRGAHHGAAVRRDPAHPVLDHRADHPGDLRDRRLHGAHVDVRCLADARVRRDRVHLQEARLSARAARAGARPGRPAESSFRQALLGSQGDLSIFFSNGLVGTIMSSASSCSSGRSSAQRCPACASGLTGRGTRAQQRKERTMPVIAMTQEVGTRDRTLPRASRRRSASSRSATISPSEWPTR